MAKKTQSYLGVDLGGGGIKMVELQGQDGRARLLTYGYTSAAPLGENWLDDKKKTAELIKKIYVKAKVSARQAVTALPSHLVFTSILTLPKLEEKDLLGAVEAEIKKLTGREPSEQTIDFQKIIEAKSGDGSGFSRVLVNAARKKLVMDYTEVFALAGLKLVNLEVESFAWIRSLVGKDAATVLIVDMGSVRTNVLIVSEGVPRLSRSIAAGGQALSEAIMRTTGMSQAGAEALKRDAGLGGKLGAPEDFPRIFKNALMPLTTEIKYFLDNYFSANEGARQIDRVILTGGSAHLAGLTEYLGKLFNLRVFVGDPWARVLYNPELRPILDELGPRFTTAVGLAMKEIEK